MTRKKDQSENKSSYKRFIEFIESENTRFILGLILGIFTIVLFISCLSYFFTWKEDQSQLELGAWQFYFDKDITSRNACSKFGALLSHFFIHTLFGLPSLYFIFVSAMFTIKLILDKEPIKFSKILSYGLLGMVWFSLVLSFFCGNQNFAFGGVFGHEVVNWLESLIGKIGTFLIIFGSLIGFIYLKVDNSKIWTKIFVHDLRKYKNVKVAFNNANEFSKIKSQNKDYQEDNKPKENHYSNNNNFGENTSKGRQFSPFDSSNQLNSGVYSTSNNTLNNDYQPKNTTTTITLDNDGKEVQPKLGGVVIDEDDEEFISSIQNKDNNTSNDNQEDIDFEIKTPQSDYQESSNLEIKGTDTMEVTTNVDNTLSAEDVDNLEPFDPTKELSNYKFPLVEFLTKFEGSNGPDKEELLANKNSIVEILEEFNIKIEKIKATTGPTVTLYELVPGKGQKISRIINVQNDIQLRLKAIGIRIIAPLPGAGTVGIEVPNRKPDIVSMRSLILDEKFQKSKFELPIALGKTISNESYIIDLVKCPHLLVAGATGQGKSVGLNAIIASILYKKHPQEVKFVLVDPKKVELSIYEKIEQHYLAKLPDAEEAIITDTKKVIDTLNSLTVEMMNRYDIIKESGLRNIAEYNKKFCARHLNPEKGHRFLPYIVVIIDEFADLIMTAGKEIEKPIARIAQLARAVGIHLIIATQRPTTNIITGLIKANFPTRIAFKVSQMIDSRTILDQPGANNLIGRGDMLITQGSDLVRLQCAFIDTPEIEQITEHISNQPYLGTMILPEPDIESDEDGGGEVDMTRLDSLFDDAAYMIVGNQQGSTSNIQRKFSIGYNRAGRIMDQLEAAGIVGPAKGSKPREVLIDDVVFLEQRLQELHERYSQKNATQGNLF